MPLAAQLPPLLATRLTPVCVAVAAPGVPALLEQALAALAESTFLELRLDLLDTPPEQALAGVEAFCRANPHAAVLVTCRRTAGGGGFAGTTEQQLALLLECARRGALLVDVELETLELVGRERLTQFGDALADAGGWLLVSAHDFRQTGDMHRTLARLRMLGAPCQPAIYKVVTTAITLGDNLRMLRFLDAESRQVPLVGLAMGVSGLVSRVLSLAWGGLFTFASPRNAGVTAPGQVPAATLLATYRAAGITRPGAGGDGGTRLYGVVGNPVEHSLSPVLHNAAFQAEGIDAVYLPLHTTSLEDLMTLVDGLSFAGLSVTMPWKIDILPCLAAVDALAARIGAVNTVVRRADGSLFGTNTDAAAVVEPLRAALATRGVPLREARVLLLGAGGAARAAAFGLVQEGAAVSIWNRSESSALALAEASGAAVAAGTSLGRFDQLDVPSDGDPDAGAAKVAVEKAGSYDAVIQATPAGMLGSAADELPLAAETAATLLVNAKVVFEMVYRPAVTPLVRLGIAHGAEIVYGLTMFVAQGAQQWSLWTGRQAPEAVMREALERALRQEPPTG